MRERIDSNLKIAAHAQPISRLARLPIPPSQLYHYKYDAINFNYFVGLP